MLHGVLLGCLKCTAVQGCSTNRESESKSLKSESDCRTVCVLVECLRESDIVFLAWVTASQSTVGVASAQTVLQCCNTAFQFHQPDKLAITTGMPVRLAQPFCCTVFGQSVKLTALWFFSDPTKEAPCYRLHVHDPL